MDYPLDPKVELVKWGPSPATVFYADWFKGIFFYFPKEYPGYAWAKTLQLMKGSYICAMMEANDLHECGGKLFLGEMLPKEKREKTRAKWKEVLAVLRTQEHEIENLDVSNLSDAEFLALWRKFHNAIDTFWCWCVLPELSNYGSSEILKDRLAEFVLQSEQDSVMEILTAPEGFSFYQEEEINLAETNDIAAHQKKYFWLNNGYDHVSVLPVEFFEKRKKEISPNVRKDATERLAAAKMRKLDAQKKYNLSEEIMQIAEAIADGILWQDTRKGDIFTYLHYKDLLLNEAVRRSGIEKDSLLTLLSYEIADVLEGKEPIVSIESRKSGFGLFMNTNLLQIIDTETARSYWDMYVEPPISTDTSECRGIVACKGNGVVQGTVRIVLDPRKAEAFKPGEILVTTMTTPEYIFIMKNASAIVTDAGGLMSHAAIVARELNVPCVIGTRIATKVFKDGDMVEVDAEKGIVRILK